MAKKADFGPKCIGSLMSVGLDTPSSKTVPSSLTGDSTESFAILPRFGLMLDGVCFQLPMLEHATGVNEYGSLEQIGTPIATARSRGKQFIEGGRKLNPFEICKADGGRVKIAWIEHLMGWPIGWTDTRPLAMVKFQQWLSAHGERSSGD